MGSTKMQRIFWDFVYDRFAWVYDAVDIFTFNAAQNFRRTTLEYIPESAESVLEIGIGPGKLHRLLATRYQCAGVDIARGMLRMTKRRLQKQGLTSALCRGDSLDLPWADASFDAVVSSFVLSAIAEGQNAINEMRRVVKPGGTIIILDAGEAEDRNWFAHTLAVMWELFGDFMRDERTFMRKVGLTVTRHEMGPGGCVHIVVGKR
jgi:ubiquinone/menaquinone biosynthesis C-methylase UbiE